MGNYNPDAPPWQQAAAPQMHPGTASLVLG